ALHRSRRRTGGRGRCWKQEGACRQDAGRAPAENHPLVSALPPGSGSSRSAEETPYPETLRADVSSPVGFVGQLPKRRTGKRVQGIASRILQLTCDFKITRMLQVGPVFFHARFFRPP